MESHVKCSYHKRKDKTKSRQTNKQMKTTSNPPKKTLKNKQINKNIKGKEETFGGDELLRWLHEFIHILKFIKSLILSISHFSYKLYLNKLFKESLKLILILNDNLETLYLKSFVMKKSFVFLNLLSAL